MKQRIFNIAAVIFIVGVLIYLNGGLGIFFKVGTVRAFGNLMVDFHMPTNAPIFTINNGKPGDVYGPKPVDATNSGTVAVSVAVKGIRTGGVGNSPLLESVLNIVINDGTSDVYGGTTGTKTLAQFFTDSSATNGIPLGIFHPGDHKTFNFTVTFPSSAGNDFQAKSVIFDLTFGTVSADHLVINEVYYQVDDKHGLDSPKDRGILGQSGNKVTIISGAGSKNIVIVSQTTACKLLQSNNTGVTTIISQSSNTGGNSQNGNTNSVNSTVTGSIGNSANVGITTGNNSATVNCGQMLGQDDEWVELFNPTPSDISLKNWSLIDNTGKKTVINANKIIKAGGFALLSKSASTWKFWTVTPGTLIVELGSVIGDGLDNSGDHLILKNPAGTEIDRMSWGTDSSGYAPPATITAPLGEALERITPGFDTDAVSDWEGVVPTPGL